MGHAVSKTALENENLEEPNEATAKEFSSHETVKLESSFVGSIFTDDAKSKISNSQIQPLSEIQSLEEEETPQSTDTPSSKPRSKIRNGTRHLRFSKNGDTKVWQNFVGKFKNKFLNIDNVLHSKAETSYVVKSSVDTGSSAHSTLETIKKSKNRKLHTKNDSLGDEVKVVKPKDTLENPSMKLEIFVDPEGGFKVDVSDENKIDKLSQKLEEKEFPKTQTNRCRIENMRKKISLETTDKESNSKFLQTWSKILTKHENNEYVEENKLSRSKRRRFCKSTSKNIETLGIKKGQEEILMQNQRPKVYNSPDKLSSKGFRKQFFGNKCDEDIISLENLMLTPKGTELQKIKELEIKNNSKNVVKFEGLEISTSKAIVPKISKTQASVEIINLKPVSETLLTNEFPVHKVLIRACSKGNHVTFTNPFSMFDMIIPDQLKTTTNVYKNSSVSLTSYTSQATENDVSELDEVISSITTSSIPKSFNLSSQGETDFCSSSEVSNGSNVSKMSLQRMPALTSFSLKDPKEVEYLCALDRISHPSAKLTFLLELKYKKKFKTLEELSDKPIEMINFLHRGELFEPTELQPVESFISYEEILNSIVSGI